MNTKFRTIIALAAINICNLAGAFTGAETVALLGDSMTWIGGDNCEKETGWTYHFKKNFPQCDLHTYARSGATWTNTAATRGDTDFYTAILDDENVIYDQVLRLIGDVESGKIKAPDIVVMFAGGNDAWFENRRPGIYDTVLPLPDDVDNVKPSQVTTLEGSIELACALVNKHLPDASIILITPPEMSKTSPERIHKVGDTIERTGKRLGLPVLRADFDLPFKHEVEKSDNRVYTYDGAHSNPIGAQIVAAYIGGRLKSLTK